MQKLNYHRIREFVVDFLAINIGMAIYSLGWAAFLLPYHITTGGMTGMFAIVYYVTGFPVSYAILIANSILLAFALWKLGWKFTIKTSYAVLALSTYLQLGQELMTDDAGNLIQVLGEGQDSMACVLGAILNGLGIGIVPEPYALPGIENGRLVRLTTTSLPAKRTLYAASLPAVPISVAAKAFLSMFR